MILESVLSVCVIGVLLIGSTRAGYLMDVHPKAIGLTTVSNPILGFAMAVGNACQFAFDIPVAVGALGGMILLEGFLVTTLDTAVRLMRYLLEEIWRVVFHVEVQTAAASGETAGACGIPATLDVKGTGLPVAAVKVSPLAKILSHYWVNSGIAVSLMLWFAFSSGILALWSLFATANQLLAAFVLLIGALWLLRRKRGAWSALIPSAFMLVTTMASLVTLFAKYSAPATKNTLLLTADGVLLVLSVYLLVCWVVEMRRLVGSKAVN
jgi:carbon starvation protein